MADSDVHSLYVFKIWKAYINARHFLLTLITVTLLGTGWCVCPLIHDHFQFLVHFRLFWTLSLLSLTLG